MIESSQEGEFGELFSTIIVEQFLRLRDADPEWYENDVFDAETKLLIDNTSFTDIIIAVTGQLRSYSYRSFSQVPYLAYFG